MSKAKDLHLHVEEYFRYAASRVHRVYKGESDSVVYHPIPDSQSPFLKDAEFLARRLEFLESRVAALVSAGNELMLHVAGFGRRDLPHDQLAEMIEDRVTWAEAVRRASGGEQL